LNEKVARRRARAYGVDRSRRNRRERSAKITAVTATPIALPLVQPFRYRPACRRA
jgi:hypothetical protein